MKQRTMDEVYRKWFKPVRSWIRKRNVPPIWIDDIAQEVFLKLLRYNPDLEIETNVAGYVFRTATNVANEWMERSHIKKPHDSTDHEDYGLSDLRMSGEEIMEQRQLIQQMELAMSKIEGRRLLVLMLHIYEEKSYKDIAKELGLTYRIVLRELTRAYDQLRREMKLTGLSDLYLVNLEEGEKDGRDSIPEPAGADDAIVRDSSDDVGITS